MPQVQKWNPPSNPAKQTDSRFAAYARRYGNKSWELDAVEPRRLRNLVEDVIVSLIDKDQWDIIEEKEKRMRDDLKVFAQKYVYKDEE
jgi:hypothetical protein